jgi:hypothetical protein
MGKFVKRTCHPNPNWYCTHVLNFLVFH